MPALSVLLLWFLPSLTGQTLQVLSEFRRVDAVGKIVPSDAPGRPREILSPGMVRNGYHSLRVVIRPPAGKPYTLDAAQNPENAVTMRFYRENGDSLTPVKLPVAAMGGIVESYWLDVFVPAGAPVRRIRLEVQLHDGDTWHIYPMEARVLSALLPTQKPKGAVTSLPPFEQPADAAAWQPWREWLCQETPASRGSNANTPGVRSLLRRNALQDVALARLLRIEWGQERFLGNLAGVLGAPDVPAWCAAPAALGRDPERYLRVRDMLYREASR